ncbi:hypothetical protein ACLM45_05800 [Synechococcus sp. A10-1-5-9]|uniref:hypothetical protein n=1 Tax=Synechococcus sp. A10-1-5-9 TaxID=3392295 RepID=UPI0039E793F6
MEILVGAVLWFGGAFVLIVLIHACWFVPALVLGLIGQACTRNNNTPRRSERRR